jgi:hypothetical protein
MNRINLPISKSRKGFRAIQEQHARLLERLYWQIGSQVVLRSLYLRVPAEIISTEDRPPGKLEYYWIYTFSRFFMLDDDDTLTGR